MQVTFPSKSSRMETSTCCRSPKKVCWNNNFWGPLSFLSTVNLLPPDGAQNIQPQTPKNQEPYLQRWCCTGWSSCIFFSSFTWNQSLALWRFPGVCSRANHSEPGSLLMGPAFNKAPGSRTSARTPFLYRLEDRGRGCKTTQGPPTERHFRVKSLCPWFASCPASLKYGWWNEKSCVQRVLSRWLIVPECSKKFVVI